MNFLAHAYLSKHSAPQLVLRALSMSHSTASVTRGATSSQGSQAGSSRRPKTSLAGRSEWNRSNICSRESKGMPGPSSLIRMATRSSVRARCTAIVPPGGGSSTVRGRLVAFDLRRVQKGVAASTVPTRGEESLRPAAGGVRKVPFSPTRAYGRNYSASASRWPSSLSHSNEEQGPDAGTHRGAAARRGVGVSGGPAPRLRVLRRDHRTFDTHPISPRRRRTGEGHGAVDHGLRRDSARRRARGRRRGNGFVPVERRHQPAAFDGIRPCGRHSRISTISPMFENIASLGAIKPT